MKKIIINSFIFLLSCVFLLSVTGCSTVKNTTSTAVLDVSVVDEQAAFLEPLSDDNQPISFDLSDYGYNALRAHAQHNAFGIDTIYRYEYTVYEVQDPDPAINGAHLALRVRVQPKTTGKWSDVNFFDLGLDVYKIKKIQGIGSTLKMQVAREVYSEEVEGDSIIKIDKNYEFIYNPANNILHATAQE